MREYDTEGASERGEQHGFRKQLPDTRRRPAPRLRRTAISRRRAAARASRRFARFAQAMARIRATIVISTYSGLE